MVKLKNLLIIIFLTLISGCAINRLAPPAEPFNLVNTDPSNNELGIVVEDSRIKPERASYTIEDGFIVGDDQITPKVVEFLKRQIATEIISSEFKDKILEKMKSKPIRLIAFDVKIQKYLASQPDPSRYNYLPAGQAAFGHMMDSFSAELARSKRVIIKIQLEINSNLYTGDSYSSYNIIPTSNALSEPAKYAVKQIIQMLGEEVVDLQKKP